MTQQPPPGWQSGGPSQQPPHPQQPQFAAPGQAQPPQGAPHPGAPYQGGPYQGHPGQFPGGAAPATKKSKTPLIIAGAIALALVIGGVVFALNFFRGATPEAAKGLPADVLGAVELNLAPSSADQLELARIINKFPLPEEMSETKDYKQALWELLPDDGDAPDYETEIKPWLGDSIAIGIRDVHADDPSANSLIVAIETTDKAKATAFAEAEFQGNSRFFFVDDVLVVTDADDPLDEASLKGQSLADSADYKADLAKLGGNPLATGWFGPRAMDEIIKLAQTQGTLSAPEMEQLRGARGAFGLAVSANKLSFDTSMHAPNQPETKLKDISGFAGDLSGTGLAAFAMSAATETYEQLWQLADDSPEVRDGLRQFGITSAADLEALFGHQIGVSVGYDEASGMPIVGATFVSADPARQKELINKIAPDLQAAAGGPPIDFQQTGDVAHLAFGQSMDAVSNPSAKLKDAEQYQQVIGGSAESLFYLDLNGIKGLQAYRQLSAQAGPEIADWLEPLAAIGVSGSMDDDRYSNGSFQITFN